MRILHGSPVQLYISAISNTYHALLHCSCSYFDVSNQSVVAPRIGCYYCIHRHLAAQRVAGSTVAYKLRIGGPIAPLLERHRRHFAHFWPMFQNAPEVGTCPWQRPERPDDTILRHVRPVPVDLVPVYYYYYSNCISVIDNIVNSDIRSAGWIVWKNSIIIVKPSHSKRK